MANTYSIIRKQQPYINPYDVNDIEKTLAVKEGRYNANVAQVQQAISQFASIDLVRDQDKEYLYNNLKDVISIVDNTDGIDFSKTGLGTNLSYYISQAVDKNVLTQAANTHAIRKYGSKLETLQAENPENYSQINDIDAKKQAGYYEYMQGNTDKLGTLNYNNYVDVEKEVFEHVKMLKEVFPDNEVEIMDPKTGRTQIKKVSSLNSSEWERYIDKSFNAQQLTQLGINGRATYGWDDNAAITDLEERRTALGSAHDSKIEKLKALRVGASDHQKQIIDGRIEAQEKLKTSDLAELDVQGKTAGQIGTLLAKREISMSLANSLSKETLISDKVDYKYLKAQADYLEALKLQGGEMAIGGTSGVITRSMPIDLNKDLDPITAFDEQYAQSVEAARTTLANAYDSIKAKRNEKTGNTFGEDIDALEQQVIAEFIEKEGREPSEFELHGIVVDKAKSWLPADMNAELGKAVAKAQAFTVADQEATKSTIDNLINKNSTQLYEQTFNEERQMAMFTKDGKQTTYGQYLREQGVTDRKSFDKFLVEDTEASKIYRANLMLQAAHPGEFMTNIRRQLALGANLSTAPIASIMDSGMSKEEGKKLSYAKEILGEENFGNILGKIATLENEGDLSQGLAGISLLWAAFHPDNTIANETQLSGVHSDKDFRSEYDRELRISSANLPGMNRLVVSPQLEKGRPTNPLYLEIEALSGVIDIDVKQPVEIIKRPNGSYAIVQASEQNVVTNKYTGVSEKKSVYKSIGADDILAVDIRPDNLPNLYRLIEDQEEEAQIKFQTQRSQEKAELFYYDSSPDNQQGLSDIFGNNPMLISMASKNEAPFIIRELTQDVLTGKPLEAVNMYHNVVDQAIKQSDKFAIGLQTSKDGSRSNVSIRMKNKNYTGKNEEYIDILSFPLQNVDSNFENIFHAAPQVFLTQSLRIAGEKYGTYGDSGFDVIQTIANNLE